LGASVMTAALGTTGPVGILTFMAIKHLAAPALFGIAKKALANKSPGPKLENASVVSASDDEDSMKALIEGLSDYAENGEIPPEAWKAAIAELGGGAALEQEPESQKAEGPDTGSGITSRLLRERARCG
jgi:hypothetical protein